VNTHVLNHSLNITCSDQLGFDIACLLGSPILKNVDFFPRELVSRFACDVKITLFDGIDKKAEVLEGESNQRNYPEVIHRKNKFARAIKARHLLANAAQVTTDRMA
jgi:hypothetical protein